jgi:ATP-dependent DNA helicase RecG
LPEPLYEQEDGGVTVNFRKDIYTEDSLRTIGLNLRQIKAVLLARKDGSITNSIYQSISHIGKSTATEDLNDLIEKKIFKQTGTKGRGSKYELSE